MASCGLEIWLPIPGCPGYEVSDRGNVRSLDRVVRRKDTGTPVFHRGMVLKPFIRRGRGGEGIPYRSVDIRGSVRTTRIGLLVLAAHVGPRPPGQTMRHLNDDSLDDRLSNLAWGTPSQNMQDAYRNGRVRLRGEKNGHARLAAADVVAIRARAAAGETQTNLAKQYGVALSTIHAIVHRVNWQHI